MKKRRSACISWSPEKDPEFAAWVKAQRNLSASVRDLFCEAMKRKEELPLSKEQITVLVKMVREQIGPTTSETLAGLLDRPAPSPPAGEEKPAPVRKEPAGEGGPGRVRANAKRTAAKLRNPDS